MQVAHGQGFESYSSALKTSELLLNVIMTGAPPKPHTCCVCSQPASQWQAADTAPASGPQLTERPTAALAAVTALNAPAGVDGAAFEQCSPSVDQVSAHSRAATTVSAHRLALASSDRMAARIAASHHCENDALLASEGRAEAAGGCVTTGWTDLNPDTTPVSVDDQPAPPIGSLPSAEEPSLWPADARCRNGGYCYTRVCTCFDKAELLPPVPVKSKAGRGRGTPIKGKQQQPLAALEGLHVPMCATCWSSRQHEDNCTNKVWCVCCLPIRLT